MIALLRTDFEEFNIVTISDIRVLELLHLQLYLTFPDHLAEAKLHQCQTRYSFL